MNKFLLAGFLILNFYVLLSDAFTVNRPPVFEWTEEEKKLGQKQVGDTVYNWEMYQKAMNKSTGTQARLLGVRFSVWNGGYVPYTISSNYKPSQVALIHKAHKLLSQYTNGCLKFYEKRMWDLSWVNYIRSDQGGASATVILFSIFLISIKIIKYKFKLEIANWTNNN